MPKIYVQNTERAVVLRSGAQPVILPPGTHRIKKSGEQVTMIDLRPTLVRIAGQETLTADGVSVRCGATVTYKIIDPLGWTNASRDNSGEELLYLDAQLAMRDLIAAADATALLSTRSELSKAFAEQMAPAEQAYGITVVNAQIRDISFPGDLRIKFAQVALAKQESAAGLERARGEQATLRSLANAARQLESNPQLHQLRALIALERGGGQLVINASDTGSANTKSEPKAN